MGVLEASRDRDTETGQTASRAAPVMGLTVEQGAQEAMVDQGTREAIAEQGAWVAMADPGIWEAMARLRP